MRRKGFTLIELLAVILILGIIALIAIPTVNNIINESKVGAWKSTGNNVVSSYERYYQICQMKGDTCITNFAASGLTGNNVKSKLGLKGDLPTNFTVLKLNSDGDALVKFTVDGITCQNFSDSNPTKPINMTCNKSNSGDIPQELCSITSGSTDVAGSEITCGTESFYVLYDTSDSIKMIAKYSLKVGGVYDDYDITYTPYSESEMTYMQDSTMVIANDIMNGATQFSSETQKGINYSDYEGSIAQSYVNIYKQNLIALGYNVSAASLLTYDDLFTSLDINLNDENDAAQKMNSNTWLVKVGFWMNYAFDSVNIMTLSGTERYDYYCQIRPVITIPKTSLEIPQ